jgi:hypothetical protein
MNGIYVKYQNANAPGINAPGTFAYSWKKRNKKATRKEEKKATRKEDL